MASYKTVFKRLVSRFVTIKEEIYNLTSGSLLPQTEYCGFKMF